MNGPDSTLLRSHASERERWAQLALIAVLGALAFVSGLSFDHLGPKPFLFAFGAVAGAYALFLPASLALRLMFFYMGFEGMFKLLTNYNPAFYVACDAIVLALSARWLLGLLVRRERMPPLLPPLLFGFAAHFAWVLIEFANPYALGLVPSLAASKLYVNMVLLYAFGFYLARDVRSIRSFMLPWILIAIIQIITGLYQASIGPASVTGLSANYAAQLLKYQGFAFRPFGTTGLAGGAAIYMYMAVPFIVYFLFQSRSVLFRFFMLTLLPLGGTLLAFCQVRSAIFKALFASAGFLLLGLRHRSAQARRRLFLGVPFVIAVCVFALPYMTSRWVEDNKDNAMALERSSSLFDVNSFGSAREGAADRVKKYAVEFPLGAGMSRTGAAAGKFWAEIITNPYYSSGMFTDNFWAATIAEIGIPGSLLMTALILGVLLLGARHLPKIASDEYRALQAVLLCSLAAIVVGLWGAEGLLYNPEAAYFWFFAGVLMRIPYLDRAQSGSDIPARL